MVLILQLHRVVYVHQVKCSVIIKYKIHGAVSLSESTLFILMDFFIHIDKICMDLSICTLTKVSQVEIFKFGYIVLI